jgi:AraC-like DNA-binding protein
MKQGSLPLIRLSAINPFLIELRRRGNDPASLLEELGLPRDIPAPRELFAAAVTVYSFVERSAGLADDPFLGYTIGSGLDLHSWDPIARASAEAGTVGELLTLFAMQGSQHSSATTFFLRIDGARCTFGFERAQEPPFTPAQNDAFYMGFMVRLLILAAAELWDAREVLFTVADPACIPSSASSSFRIAAGDRSGVRIRFPSQWLLRRFEKSLLRDEVTEVVDLPQSLLDAVRTALTPHLHEPDLTAEKAATICGYERRRLAKALRDRGTTLTREIARLRATKAEQDLSNTDRRIGDIGAALGFTDPTVFSRAFKNWTGQSPQEYRRTRRSPSEERKH